MATRPKDRRAIILRAAADLFADRGFASVGIDDIGAAVGITGPAIYHHFRGKAGLLAVLLGETATRHADAVEGALADPHPSLEGVLAAVIDLVLAEPAMTAAYLRERAAGRSGPELAAIERRLALGWTSALDRFTPHITGRDRDLRQAAAFALVTTAGRRPGGVTRPRLHELLVGSAAAVVRAEPRPVGPARDAGWTPPADRREEALHAALALFRSDGFGRVAMTDIGAAIGLTGPTLYHYFESKAQIVLEAYDRVGEQVAVGAVIAAREASDGKDALGRLVRSYVGIALDNVDLIVVATREAEAIPSEERPRLQRRAAGLRSAWVAALREHRSDLSDDELSLLVRTAHAVVHAAAEAAEPGADRVDDVVSIVRAHLGTERSFDTVERVR